MNGPEHYRRAEALLVSCQSGSPDYDDEGRPVEGYPAVDIGNPDVEDGMDSCRNALLAAQVHALLAHTAATAQAAGLTALEGAPWRMVVSS